jgi:hypothetical protein
MDIQMSNMGGIDAARITREKLGPECPAAEPTVHLAVEYSIEFSSPRLVKKTKVQECLGRITNGVFSCWFIPA